jgi:molybdopterin-containing oxidoreductase family molybdopterin binding subunit
MINHGANVIMSLGNKDAVAQSLSKYKFIVSFELFLTETAEFSDIVLPDCDNLQSYDSRSNYPFINGIPGGMGEWCWPMRHPVDEPQGSQRRVVDVCAELARRAGFLAEYNAAVNAILKLDGPYRLEPDRLYTHEEISDADLKSKFGAEHDLAWFKKNGLIKWPKKPHEVYWRAFVDVRVPIYWEFMTGLGEKIAAITGPKGFDVPLEYYQPLPDWLPCPSHQCNAPGFDLFAFYWKHSAHTHGYTIENPWLDEAAKLDPIIYKVAINTETGRRKGLENESVVEITTEKGRRITGRVQLMEGIHPEAIGVGLTGGHWANGMPLAKGKGVLFNELLEMDWEHTDPVSLNLDLCAKVKIAAVEDLS